MLPCSTPLRYVHQVIAINQDPLGVQGHRARWQSFTYAESSHSVSIGRWFTYTFREASVPFFLTSAPPDALPRQVWSSQSFMHLRTAVEWAARMATRNLPIPTPVPLKRDGQEVWAGPLADGSVAAILLNRANESADITAKWEDMGAQ